VNYNKKKYKLLHLDPLAFTAWLVYIQTL